MVEGGTSGFGNVVGLHEPGAVMVACVRTDQAAAQVEQSAAGVHRQGVGVPCVLIDRCARQRLGALQRG